MLTFSRLAMVVTVLAWAGYVTATVIREFVSNGVQNMRFATEAVTYLLIVTALTYSALAYLLARHGYLYRTRTHRRVPRAAIDEFFEESMPNLTVLVPSYREDARVIKQTMLSAALQEYPNARIVLLIDDPPNPETPALRTMLDAARAVPGEIEGMLAVPGAAFQEALERYEAAAAAGTGPDVDDMRALSVEYERAVAWLNGITSRQGVEDHADRFLVEEVIGRLRDDLTMVAAALDAAADEGAILPKRRILQLYRRLAWTFRAELTSFERKQFASLSNEPNKAMNLNSYIGLMGGSYRTVATDHGRVLQRVASHLGDLEVPDSDYVLTLDADSVLLPEYCLRLIHLLEQPENRRVAVAQTPYSAFPGSATRIERLAGATTDLQHIVHQGLTYYDATFWVGANAVLRKKALDEVAESDISSGFEIRRYIQDRTVIEDTESTIELALRGWTLVNYPERLSYSATPPDFGSLSVQRQRWANGGLLILPKLIRYLRMRRRKGERGRLGEAFLRLNYMASITWASFGLLVLLAYPYTDRLLSPLVLFTAIPYFMALGSDLKRCGYKRLDAVRIYGFNLILLPVNLFGVFRSIGQGLTGKKIAFARTPKVRNRTTAQLSFIVVPYVFVALSVFTLMRDLHDGRWGHAGFAGVNAVLTSYAIVAFIGIANSMIDVWMNIVDRLYRPERDKSSRRIRRAPAGAVAHLGGMDWEAVLSQGTVDLPRNTVPRSRRLPPRVSDRSPAPSCSRVAAAGPSAPRSPVSRTSSETRGRSAADGPARESVLRWLAEYLDVLRDAEEVSVRLDGSAVVITLAESPADTPLSEVIDGFGAGNAMPVVRLIPPRGDGLTSAVGEISPPG